MKPIRLHLKCSSFQYYCSKPRYHGILHYTHNKRSIAKSLFSIWPKQNSFSSQHPPFYESIFHINKNKYIRIHNIHTHGMDAGDSEELEIIYPGFISKIDEYIITNLQELEKLLAPGSNNIDSIKYKKVENSKYQVIIKSKCKDIVTNTYHTQQHVVSILNNALMKAILSYHDGNPYSRCSRTNEEYMMIHILNNDDDNDSLLLDNNLQEQYESYYTINIPKAIILELLQNMSSK